jgi:hypothetical protein
MGQGSVTFIALMDPVKLVLITHIILLTMATHFMQATIQSGLIVRQRHRNNTGQNYEFNSSLVYSILLVYSEQLQSITSKSEVK